VTGSSSGVGAHLVALLAKKYLVYATMRNTASRAILTEACLAAGAEVTEFDAVGPVNGPGVRIRPMDVTSDESVNNCLATIFQETSNVIDICVNNAGYSEAGQIEMLSMEACKNQYETNVFGVIRVTKAVIPKMRERQQGRMIVVSSMGGVSGIPFNDIYCSSKFAVEGLYESLAPFYKAFNVWVSIIEPGPIHTSFVTNAKRHEMKFDNEHPTMTKYKELQDSYLTKMMAGFNDKTIAQTGEEVAQHIIDHAILPEVPDVRIQTNSHPKYIAAAKAKLADTTGNVARDMMYDRFFS
jgi:NAD(P)-dependent dehydrogenase (short-subunit alcohol dehydrogenase family)